MSKFKPREGIRRDLMAIALPTEDVVNYLCEDLFPTEGMKVAAQTVYYVPTASPATPETDRTAGDEPDRTTLASATFAYSADDVSHGFELAEEEIDNLGGIENADQVGGLSAKLSIWDARELLVAGTIFNASRTRATGDTVDAAIRAGLVGVRHCVGEIALVMSQTAKLALLDDASVQARLDNVKAAIPQAGEAVEDALLRALYGVQQVKVGMDQFWTDEDDIAIVRVPPKRLFAYKSFPILGRTFVFNGYDAPEEAIEVRVVDKPYKVCYDGLMKMDIALLNEGAIRLVNLTDPTDAEASV